MSDYAILALVLYVISVVCSVFYGIRTLIKFCPKAQYWEYTQIIIVSFVPLANLYFVRETYRFKKGLK